jgi:hypothetical protein
MRNISNINCRENQNTGFIFNNFPPENRAVYEIMWRKLVESERPQMTTQHGACALHAGQLQLQTHVIVTVFSR